MKPTLSTRLWRRRRLLYSSWLRLARWEYWPPWAAYLPVAGYILWLAVKHRSLTVFTAANPAILAGGFIGESKLDILRRLPCERVARSAFINGELRLVDKLALVDAFLSTAGLQLPVVLKPNEGQRGTGVVVVRTRAALERYLSQARSNVIVQEYVLGLEFGVFYYRRPPEARGRILSITVKRLPSVIGDGRHTIEELVLRDPDTIGMARFHLQQQADRLDVVPESGAVVSLGDCGSHCRGARFYDGRSLLTPALESAIDSIAARFEGFYFGRFDLCVPSIEALQRGEHVTILELNGVTSEATHIYDPRVSLADAYRALFEQWQLAFDIGSANAARGSKVFSMRELAGLLAGYGSSPQSAAST